jgi:type III protein arginine methyltransferase
MSSFVQILNPITGKSDWEEKDEQFDYVQEIARSAFADMLHDTERNRKYFDGLAAAIKKVQSRGKVPCVLDIGKYIYTLVSIHKM